MLPYLEEQTPVQVEEIRKTIQELFRQTCILHIKYDADTLQQKNNPRYEICNKHRIFIGEYLEVLGCELVHDPQEQIFYLQGKNMPLAHVSLNVTKILLLVRLLYHEKMMGSGLDATRTTLQEIRERGRETNLLTTKLTVTEWNEALQIMKVHQMIELPCAVRNVEDTTPIYMYPTVQMFLRSADMERLLEQFTQKQAHEDAQESMAQFYSVKEETTKEATQEGKGE